MALSSNLGKSGFSPEHIQTRAQVTLEMIEGKTRITRIQLDTETKLPGISDTQFQEIAEGVKQGCPVSVALSNVPTTLVALLL